MKLKLQTFFLASGTILFTSLLILYPEQALDASLRGLDIWWKIVFPALLPFFIMAELLIGFGVVTFIGILFEPIMRPIFNVPGVGSFAWVMGMASGYPSGAKITARLREENQLTQIEAERLVSFTNNSSPLFILGAVSVGIFGDPKLGLLLAVCHYVGNAIVGFIMRFHGIAREMRQSSAKKRKVSLSLAFNEMHQTRIKDTRPVGRLLGDAVIQSIQTLLMVGGFIILFSVASRLLHLTGITGAIASVLKFGLQALTLPSEFGIPLVSGLLEITLGTQLISRLEDVNMLSVAIIISFMLGFNGFSVQAQVSSIIAKTDIRFMPYFISRLLHGTIASILAILLYKPLYVNRQSQIIEDVGAFEPVQPHLWTEIFYWFQQFGPLITMFSLAIGMVLLYQRIKHHHAFK